MSQAALILQGLSLLTSQLQGMAKRTRVSVIAHTKVEAELILKRARAYAPRLYGRLRRSGKILLYKGGPQKDGGGYVIAFGGSGMPWAIAIHEHLSVHSPPSWSNVAKTIQFTPHGTGPKFLEKATLGRIDEITRGYAEVFRKALQG